MMMVSLSEFAESQLKKAYEVNQVKQVQQDLNSFIASILNMDKLNPIFISSLNAEIISIEVIFSTNIYIYFLVIEEEE